MNGQPITHVPTTQYAQIPYLQVNVTCHTISNVSSTNSPCGNSVRKGRLNIFEVEMKMETTTQTTPPGYSLEIMY